MKRRQFLQETAALGAVYLAGYSRMVRAEPPPEVTSIRLVRAPGICIAPQYLAEDFLQSNNMSLVEVMGAYGDNVLDSPDLYDWPKVFEALQKQGYVKINKRTKNNIEFTYTGHAPR